MEITVKFYPDEGPARPASSDPLPDLRFPLFDRLVRAAGEARKRVGRAKRWQVSEAGWAHIVHQNGLTNRNAITYSTAPKEPYAALLGYPIRLDRSLPRGVIAILDCGDRP